MPRYFLPLLAAAALHAGVMDFRTLSGAKAAYEKGDYAKASEYYGKLGDKNDAARYNYADALYQQKKYKEAAEIFSQIASPALKQKALHNLGNSLARSGKTGDALKAYEAALKLGEDEDTRYNLDLLKKQQQQQNQNQKDQDQNNDQQNGQNKDGQQDRKEQQKNGQDKNHPQQSDQQQSGQKENKQQNQNDANHQDREGQAQSRPEQERNEQKQPALNAPEDEQQPGRSAEEKEHAEQAQAAAVQPISDMEERKYNKLLDKRGIQTLMIPLSGKGEPHADETTPW